MSLKVLKFGGTSVGSPVALLRTSAIIQRELSEGGLVVVSALAGTTDAIARALHLAASGDLPGARGLANALWGRHQQTAHGLGLLEAVEEGWMPLFQRLTALLEGAAVLCQAPPRVRDAALAVGETLSAQLVQALLISEGTAATFADVRQVLHTDEAHGQARPRTAAIRGAVGPWRARLSQGELLVTQGFLGSAPDGATTTLGRGGSDTSATLLGEALGASEVQIWTDVDGVLTADPSLVSAARPIPRMSLAEAQALSAFGAKVLHAACLAPVARGGFPLRVCNTLREGDAGTSITEQAQERAPGSVTSVAYKEGLVLVRFPAEVELSQVVAWDTRLQASGAQRFALASGPEGTLLAVRPEAASVGTLAELEETGAKLEHGWALVALVGEGLRSSPSSALRLLAPFQMEPELVILSGASPIAVALLVPEARLPDLIPRLHRLWIETPETCSV